MMRVKAAFTGLIAVMLTSGCADAGGLQPSIDIGDRTGTVTRVGDLGYAIVDDREYAERFAPSNLPEQFEQDGLRVRFSGRKAEIPASVRMWGTPLELTSIEIEPD